MAGSDNPKSYMAYELGNPLMSGWINNFLTRRGEYLFPFPKPGPPTPPIPPPITPNNKIIVLITPGYPIGYELIQYIINLGLVTGNVECYLQKDGETVLSLVNLYYNNGYRFFIGTQNSQELSTLITFFEKYTDSCYFNTSSTVYNLQMPSNMIRAIVNDYTLTEYINNYFILNVTNLLNISKYMTMYEPLSETPNNQPAFTKFVYIYTYSLYTSEFLNMLQTTKNENLNITIESYLIPDGGGLPSELISQLTDNPVSGENFKTSNKTLFFLNATNPQILLDEFTVESWYNNYFFFCDPFFEDILTTKYPFLYTFLGSGVFSSSGYKLSQQIDPNQDISPIALAIVNLIEPLGQFYLNNDKPETTMTDILDKLTAIQYIYQGNDNNTYWYEKLIYCYHTNYNLQEAMSEYRIFKDPLLFSASASPTQNGGVVSIQSGWSSVTFGSGQYVAVSVNGICMTSSNGSNWTIRSCPDKPWTSITYFNGIFFAVAKSSINIFGQIDNERGMNSITGGRTWNSVDLSRMAFTDVTSTNNNIVIVANKGPTDDSPCKVMCGKKDYPVVSLDRRCELPAGDWYSVTYGNNLVVAVGTKIMTSSDGGKEWTGKNVPGFPKTYTCVIYANGIYIAVTPSTAPGGGVITSSDGNTWTVRNTPVGNWRTVAYGNGLFVVLSGNGSGLSMTSPNGINWTLRSVPTSFWKSIIFGSGLFVAVASSGQNLTMRSRNGIDWSYGIFGSFLGDGTDYAVGNASTNIGVLYTIEFFVLINTSSTNNQRLLTLGNSPYPAIIYYGSNSNTNIRGKIGFQTSSSNINILYTDSTINIGSWNHVAITISSGIKYIYLNGALAGSKFLVFDNESPLVTIGDGINGIKGNITNVRITQKIVYTGNFTVPLAPLTPIQPAGTNITNITSGECIFLTPCYEIDYLKEEITGVNLTNSGLIYSPSEP